MKLMRSIGVIELVIIFAIGCLFLLPFCKVFSKAGFHWAFGLLMMVPLVNLVALFFLAFADWPILRELNALRRERT